MKVYVNIPAGEEAGGCESLYQLVDSINRCGGDAFVVWDRILNNPVPSKYMHYQIKVSHEIEDLGENWIVYPEVWTERIHTFQNLKKSIWWLSVDNNHGKFSEWENKAIYHFYQSFYAQDYLKQKGINEKAFYLNDYVSEKYLNNSFSINDKENIILFNPVKGREITNQIMEENQNFTFVPIVNLNEFQIIELLKKSKIYIDFGHHPGRDRIPREAANLGCCVITNKRGSAGFEGDIPILPKYKFDDYRNLNSIFQECFENYEIQLEDFNSYRAEIQNQKSILDKLVKSYFVK